MIPAAFLATINAQPCASVAKRSTAPDAKYRHGYSTNRDQSQTTTANAAPKKDSRAARFFVAVKQAFKYAVKFAQEFGAELTLIHILKPDISPTFPDLPGAPAFSPEELAIAEETLRELVASARSAGLQDARSTFRVGLAAHEIAEVPKNWMSI